jgi:group I intron endonuclease
MTSGIYLITNHINGKQYVGSTIDIKQRWYRHKYNAERNIHVNAHFQAAWNLYGAFAFKFEVLEYVHNVEDLARVEQYYIDWLEPVYNICRIAGNTLGRKPSASTKAKISAALSGRQLSDETRQKMSSSHKGKEPYAGATQNLLKCLPGNVFAVGNQNRRGKKHTEKTRQKMSAAHRGKRPSLETRQKLSIASKGRRFSPEARRKMSEARKKFWEEVKKQVK